MDAIRDPAHNHVVIERDCGQRIPQAGPAPAAQQNDQSAVAESASPPGAFYSDKHGILRLNAKDAIGGDRVTQFGRVLSELNIDIICANSPQAKGRVERALGTVAGPAGEGAALHRHFDDRGSERPGADIHGRLQHAVWARPGEICTAS